jgi:hypothetical protein
MLEIPGFGSNHFKTGKVNSCRYSELLRFRHSFGKRVLHNQNLLTHQIVKQVKHLVLKYNFEIVEARFLTLLRRLNIW